MWILLMYEFVAGLADPHADGPTALWSVLSKQNQSIDTAVFCVLSFARPRPPSGHDLPSNEMATCLLRSCWLNVMARPQQVAMREAVSK